MNAKLYMTMYALEGLAGEGSWGLFHRRYGNPPWCMSF